MAERVNHNYLCVPTSSDKSPHTPPKVERSQMTEEEKAIVIQARGGDEEAFGVLYGNYIDKVYKHLYYRMGNPTEAEDLAAQVFLKAGNAMERYRLTGRPFGTWLFAIGHNLLVDHYRARARKEIVSIDNVTIQAGEESDPEVAVEKALAKAELRQAIKRLKPDQQLAVVMRYIDGLDYSDIAEALHKSEGAIRVIVCRSLLRLREIMGDKEQVFLPQSAA